MNNVHNYQLIFDDCVKNNKSPRLLLHIFLKVMLSDE